MDMIALPFEQWPLVAPIVTGEFQDAMPRTPSQATFATLFDDRNLVGFAHVELLHHFNSFHIVPEYRGQGLAPRLIRGAVACVPNGHSAIWMTDDPHGTRIVKALGARELGTFQVFRKDF